MAPEGVSGEIQAHSGIVAVAVEVIPCAASAPRKKKGGRKR